MAAADLSVGHEDMNARELALGNSSKIELVGLWKNI